MNENNMDWEEALADDPDFQALSPKERKRLMGLLERMLALNIGAVYGHEEEGVPDADIDCGPRLAQCRAVCCTYHFALTKGEVTRGVVAHDRSRPFFAARDPDGYCTHLDRESLACAVWEERPLRCRRYDCREDGEIWP